ncbi:MAG: YARHG domain-containing protein [Bacteroidales bacterium]|nr:YARHG domain-containing protein [Bacteroidales bacterium]
MHIRKAIVAAVLALLAFTGLQAQDFRVGHKFTDGASEWTVQEIRMGTIVYLTNGQGDELTLEKVKGKPGTYKTVPSRQADEPVFGEAFGCPAVFMREDGYLILAFLNAEGNKVDALYPLVERGDFHFQVKFLPVEGKSDQRGSIVVTGSAGSPYAPEFETKLDLAQVYDADDNRFTRLRWVDDHTDLNFDGIPDLLVYTGTSAVRGAPSVHYGYVWNPDYGCFESVMAGPFRDLEVDPVAHTLTSYYSSGPDEDAVDIYVWKNGKLRLMGENDLAGLWYNGSLVFKAEASDSGGFLFDAMSEGEEHGFLLKPAADENDTYRLGNSPVDCVNEYADRTAKVVYRAQDGLEVLCFYAADGSLFEVMSKTGNDDAQELNADLWMAQLCGKYKADNGRSVVVEFDRITIDGKRFPLKAVTFNGQVIDIVEVGKPGMQVNTSYEIKPTAEGLKNLEVSYDADAYWYKSAGREFNLVWDDKNKSRFEFASRVLLNDRLSRYNKKTLRLMRNAILARHGYVFQSKDLKDYFTAQSWYRPAASNADITLTFIEQLNVDLIKAAEK